MSGCSLTNVAGKQFFPSAFTPVDPSWDDYAESFFLEQRSQFFVPFICKAPWTTHRLTDLCQLIGTLKDRLVQEERDLFFSQLQRLIPVYDDLIQFLGRLIESVNDHGIGWLVEKHIILAYVKHLSLIVLQLEGIERGVRLIKPCPKNSRLKKARQFILYWSSYPLFDIRELKAYLAAVHNAHSNKQPQQQEAL